MEPNPQEGLAESSESLPGILDEFIDGGLAARRPALRHAPSKLETVESVRVLDMEQRLSSVTKSWDFNDIAFYHKPSGLQISVNHDLRLDGKVYRGLPREDIEIQRDVRLGSGAEGVVHAGIYKPTGTRIAVKTVRVERKEARDQMLRDLRGLIQADGCPYLVQWYAGFVTPDTSLVNVVLEFMDLGSLSDLRRRLGGRGAQADGIGCIAAQMTMGLRFLQGRSLLHRDVKPENVLHDRAGRVKLTDFGISKSLPAGAGAGASLCTTFVGTATYMSPERVEGVTYSFQSDVWSAGLVVYELAAGRYPFKCSSFFELYGAICVQLEPRLDAGSFPEELCDFVARCLTRNPLIRPNAVVLADHPLVVHGAKEAQMAALATWLANLSSNQVSMMSTAPPPAA